jgi:hypothetical protein
VIAAPDADAVVLLLLPAIAVVTPLLCCRSQCTAPANTAVVAPSRKCHCRFSASAADTVVTLMVLLPPLGSSHRCASMVVTPSLSSCFCLHHCRAVVIVVIVVSSSRRGHRHRHITVIVASRSSLLAM